MSFRGEVGEYVGLVGEYEGDVGPNPMLGDVGEYPPAPAPPPPWMKGLTMAGLAAYAGLAGE